MANRRRRMNREQLAKAISEQKTWIKEHGETLEGYITRYGDKGQERCHGDGGTAIYNADTNALKEMEEEFAQRFGS